ncbi:MFS transporter [Hyphomicrobium sp.]|uniref:MFS transporter n=1 Tax=Hyphomicrobium sp. TaxID=82 RepID=UPI002C2940F2|nr:MFS transporter [Hyphomicrobium sp.]HVZ06021.1 MFS transporter [Hyphomicrobium sp.]
MLPNDRGQRFVLPVAVFYGALFVVYGMYVPFMPLWLDYKGLTASEISTIIAAPLFLRAFVTPVVAAASDRGGDHRRYLILLAWCAIVFVLGLTQSASFWAILILTVLLTVSNSTSMPLIDTIAVQGARARGLDYGRLRLWGSLSFVAASFAGGIAITAFGRGAGIWLIAAGCVLTLIASYNVPSQQCREREPGAVAPPLWKATEVRALLACREFQLFLMASGLAQAAHAAFFTFGTLLWQKQGLSAAWCGTLWAIGVFAEVLLFTFSSYVAGKFGAAQLIVVGAAASIVRWLALAAEPSLFMLVPLQLLHGVTYGATHIGAMHFIHDFVPRDKSASAQALYATVSAGVAMGIATLAAGYVYAIAGPASYLVMAALSVIALGAGLRLLQIWNGGMLAPHAEKLAP